MCGLAGFYYGHPVSEGATHHLVGMGDAIIHRGPDQGGIWSDPEAGIGLASRRLAVIDLSEAGHQPMESSSGRFVIAFNGEIYNHLKLRAELDGSGKAPRWRGSSDTETLLAGIEAWGLSAALKSSVGMFGLALWDRQERKLSLARDRLGEKPIYFGWQGLGSEAAFLFGSELKAVARHPVFEAEIDRDALEAYMREGYIPAPQSIYRNISKLEPGCILTLERGRAEPSIERYWSPSDHGSNGSKTGARLNDVEAVDELERLLSAAVADQLISDVPLGAFLSGGIDSSAIVALMQNASNTPVKTFTIASEDERFDEAPFARRIAQHLGTDHHEMVVTAEDALGVIPRLPTIYDEPFADSSQVPTLLISELARGSVKVALSGDGGDELFGGYDTYLHASRIWRRVRNVPPLLRSAVGNVLRSIPPALLNSVGGLANIDTQHSTVGDKVRKGATLMSARAAEEMRRSMTQRWPDGAIVIEGKAATYRRTALGSDPAEDLMALDLEQYLPDDILVKVDRAAMSVSLETRAPYLDHRVVEFATELPLRLKIRSGTSKWILRRLLSRHVPDELFERPKKGFGIPVDEWLRGPLRSWAEDLLAPRRLKEQGFLRSEPIERSWRSHLSGRSNRQAQLWTVLMFQAWLEQTRGDGATPLQSTRQGVEDARVIIGDR